MIDKYAAAKGSQITDNQEFVQLYPRLTESTFGGPYPLYRAQRSRKYKADNAGGRMLLKQRMVWRLWRTDLDNSAAPLPKMKDKITDYDGTNFIIIEDVQVLYHGKQFVCECQESTNI